MCGIAGFHVLSEGYDFDRDTLAASLLLNIDDRGGDATGYATFGPSGTHVQKASCRAGTFLTGWKGIPEDAVSVLLHTRWATQGKAAFPENNHPVACGPVHVVHNGHINNDATLFSKLGKTRLGFVDSEAIAAVIVSAGWDDPATGLAKLDGAFAIAAANENRPGEIILAKGGWSPLVWYSNGKLLVWASESLAIRNAWRETFGTPPIIDRINYATEGTLLKVRHGVMCRDRFAVKRQWVTVTPATTWTATKPLSCAVTVDSEPTKLGDKLGAALAKRNGWGTVWDPSTQTWVADGYDDVDLIRCGCCDDWTDPLTMDEAFGELVCQECLSALREDSELVLR